MLEMEIHQATELAFRLGDLPNHIQVELTFDWTPTKEQVVAAMRHLLQEDEFKAEVALLFIEAAERCTIPEPNTCEKFVLDQDFLGKRKIVIWNLPRILFKIPEEKP